MSLLGRGMQVCLLRRRIQRVGTQGFCNLMLNGVVVRSLGYCRRMGENWLSHSDRTELVEKRGEVRVGFPRQGVASFRFVGC